MKMLKWIFPVFCMVSFPFLISAQTWTDISTPQITTLGGSAAQSYPGGCSGIVANRLTGDVFVHIVGFGIWKSSNKGGSWARVDNNTIDGAGGGRCENGWGIQVDQDDPARMAVFTLDGEAGYTADGTTWKRWTHAAWGRNWDYGSVDWSSPAAKTIIGVEHEKPSQVVALSTNAGTSWTELTNFDVAGAAYAMVGVIDSTTLIGCRGAGIVRSTNLGTSWSTVSSVNVLSHVPVRFKGRFYLTSATGLLVSADKGLTWTQQGSAIAATNMYQGPYFGADENTMVVGTNTETGPWSGTSSIYKSTNAGTTWQKITDVPATSQQFKYVFSWFGGFSWDPVNNVYYATAMSNPAFKKEFGTQTVYRAAAAVTDKTFSVAALPSGRLTFESAIAGRISVYNAGGILVDAFPLNAKAASTRAATSAGVYLVKLSAHGADQVRCLVIR